MSFSTEVKDNLIKIERENSCCKKSFLYGLCIFGKSFTNYLVSLQTENHNIANLYSQMIKEICNVKMQVKISPKGRSITVSTLNENDAVKILRTFGHDGHGSLKINHSNFYCDECINSFIAGAFLACGTISNPNKDYHLEFSIPFHNLYLSLENIFEELELSPKYSNRKGYNVIYFKESEKIENCLYLMGASDAMFEIMHIKILKDFRNKANRRVNCETANLSKMASATALQINAIENIWSKVGKDYLNAKLEKVAEIRYDNPDLSLSELCEVFDENISKSGLNHRLNRIVEISNQIEE